MIWLWMRDYVLHTGPVFNTHFVNRICLAGLIAIVSVRMWTRCVTAPSVLSTPGHMVDFSLNLDLANKTCDQRRYPPNFVYPLPGILFWRAMDALDFRVGTVIWLLVLPASMIGSLFVAEALVGRRWQPYGGIVMALAFAAMEYYLIWDLKAANTNSFYLVLVLLGCWCWQKDRPILAGTLLAASVSIKLYSIVFLLYIVARREWRIGLSMLSALLIFFVGIPMVYFGWHDTFVLTNQWISAVVATSRAGFIYPAYRVSLSWIATLLMNPTASGGKLNLANCNPNTVAVTIKLLYLGWALAVAGYFASTWSFGRPDKNQPLPFLWHVSVLLFCLLPVSSVLEPHHLVVLLLPAVCLIHVMFADEFPKRIRALAGLTVALGACLTELSPRYPLRGVGVQATLLAYLAGIWIIHRGQCRSPLHPLAPGRSSANRI